MSAVSKEGDGKWLTDEVLLSRLRGPSGSIARATRRGAADRIEEYCRDAAVAEEAMLRCFMATGKTVDDVKNGDTIDTMAEHVIRCISEETEGARDAVKRGLRLYNALESLEQAYTNKHSPQHRAACLSEARAALAKNPNPSGTPDPHGSATGHVGAATEPEGVVGVRCPYCGETDIHHVDCHIRRRGKSSAANLVTEIVTAPVELEVAEARIGCQEYETGIYVRAKRGAKWGSYDIAELTRESLIAWLRSRGEKNEWAEQTVLILLDHTFTPNNHANPDQGIGVGTAEPKAR